MFFLHYIPIWAEKLYWHVKIDGNNNNVIKTKLIVWGIGNALMHIT